VPGWLVQGTAAGLLTRMAMLIGGSGIFSAGSQPGHPGRYAGRGWDPRGALWEMRGAGQRAASRRRA
jgi:hypothetical protein